MKRFNESIRHAIKFLNDIDFLMQAGTANSLTASSELKKTTRCAENYKKIYDAGIKLQEFNILMNDHSYFQFSMMCENEIRLAYYPNPYNYAEFKNQIAIIDSFLNEGYPYDEISQLISEDIYSYDIPYIRLDISRQQYCPYFHPFAHFHIGFYSENRWPVKRLLSPFAFVLFILNHYYVTLCKDLINKKDIDILTLYQDEVDKCPILIEEFFQPDEQKRLYFT